MRIVFTLLVFIYPFLCKSNNENRGDTLIDDSGNTKITLFLDLGGINHYYSFGMMFPSKNKKWENYIGLSYFDPKIRSRYGGTITLISYELLRKLSSAKKNYLLMGFGVNIGFDLSELIFPSSQICPAYTNSSCPIINYYSLNYLISYKLFIKKINLMPGILVKTNFNIINNLTLWPLIRFSYQL